MVRLGLALTGVIVLTLSIPVVCVVQAVGREQGIAVRDASALREAAVLQGRTAGEREAAAKKTAARKDGAAADEADAQKAAATEKGAADKKAATKDDAASGKRTVSIEWYGQSCFLIKTEDGVWICIDPFDPEKMPYSLPEGPVTLAFASHDHFDHNNLGGVYPSIAIKGGAGGAMVTDPLKMIPPYGTYTFSTDSTTYSLTVVPSYHDDANGEKRGLNTISVWEIDGFRIVHLGDLGSGLDAEQMKAIGRPDVLMIPVGGYYTIDAEQAHKIVDQLSPHIVIPMHFKTKALGDKLPISGVEGFLQGWKEVTKAQGSVLSLKQGGLPEGPEIVLLKYHGQAD
jgi:L-ascorbate metabolism protein UlaG (beta-lactamase superfamily)